MKILFYGFRHSHIYALYNKVTGSEAFEIAGCIEADADARTAAEKQLGANFTNQSYSDILASDIDVVAIGTAYGDRGKAVISALEAGKHVIADKPVCTSQKELDVIERLATEKGLSVVCMLELRYLPQALKAKEIIRGGELGEVRNISIFGQHCLNYGQRPMWYFEEGMHGGTINDIAIHGVDLVRMITGLEIEKTDMARTWNAYAAKQRHFNDCAVFAARLTNGAELISDVSYSAPQQVFSMPTYWEFRFWCDKGMLTFSYAGKDVTLYRNGATSPETVDCADMNNGRDYLSDLIYAINSGDNSHTKELIASTRTVLKIQQVADKERNNG